MAAGPTVAVKVAVLVGVGVEIGVVVGVTARVDVEVGLGPAVGGVPEGEKLHQAPLLANVAPTELMASTCQK